LQPTWHAQPPQLHDWLEARGLPAYFEWVVWVRDAAPAPRVSADAEIVRVTRDRADAFGQAVSRVFDKSPALMPWYGALVERRGWSHYAALDADRIAAVAALYVRDGIAWLGWGGTLPEYRGRGLQSALIARRITDAIAAGARELTVETAADVPERSNPSYRNVARAGFQELHRRPSHAYFPPEQKG
jgi:GNAT superfamily N-acetyltransferase